MVCCSTCSVFHMWQFCRFFYCLASFDTLNSIVCRVQPIRYTMTKFSLIDFVIKLTMFEIRVFGKAISTPSCSYCVGNSCCQNHSRNLPNWPLYSMIDTDEFNRLPTPNDRMYFGEVFAGRFHNRTDRVISTPSWSYGI